MDSLTGRLCWCTRGRQSTGNGCVGSVFLRLNSRRKRLSGKHNYDRHMLPAPVHLTYRYATCRKIQLLIAAAFLNNSMTLIGCPYFEQLFVVFIHCQVHFHFKHFYIFEISKFLWKYRYLFMKHFLFFFIFFEISPGFSIKLIRYNNLFWYFKKCDTLKFVLFLQTDTKID